MVHKAEPFTNKDKMNDEFGKYEYKLNHSDRNSKGALIGTGAGFIGGAIGGHIWSRKNRKASNKATKDYKRSLSKDQSILNEDIEITSRHLRNQSDIASGLGSLAGPAGKVIGGGLAALSQRNERLSLARKQAEFRRSLTKEQKAKINLLQSHNNKAGLKQFISTIGGSIVGGVGGYYIAKATDKKYSFRDKLYSEEEKKEMVKRLFKERMSERKVATMKNGTLHLWKEKNRR